jgi:hypothetical protein
MNAKTNLELMKPDRLKNDLPVITSAIFNAEPNRYELRKGNSEEAPLCPFGNHFKWIGYDTKTKQYIRFTKSIYKRLIQQKDKEIER